VTTATFPEHVPAVQRYAKLLLELDQLMVQGKGNSPEADELREQMEMPWFEMSDSERERVGGLSEDLYALVSDGKAIAMSPAERAEYGSEAKAALHEASDPNMALAFLRRPCPNDIPKDAIPFLQARQWERLGDLNVALRFMRAAEQRNPKQAASVLILLEKLGRREEAKAYAQRILADSSADFRTNLVTGHSPEALSIVGSST
jgi:hypothetical protein